LSFLTLVYFVAGIVLLILGAESLVRGASRIALALGISSLVIGLTVVAFGTSSPELAVSLHSTFNNQPDVAIGNVVGSNIFNILFILGIAGIIAPLAVARQLIKFDVPLMIIASFVLLLFASNGMVGRLEGAVLFLGLIAYITILIRFGRKGKKEFVNKNEFKSDNQRKVTFWIINIGLVAAGLVMLVIGSNLLLDAAVTFARLLGVSELVIGLTIVAAGTSLPEVFTSVIAQLKGERDIAVGNIIGSNIFNILCIIGLSGFLAPDGIKISAAAINVDIPVMIAASLACLPIFITGNIISRWEGILFFFYYLVYTLFLILKSTHHDSLPFFSSVVMIYLLPVTLLSLIIVSFRYYKCQRKISR
jgi:cation:H+ antiporter